MKIPPFSEVEIVAHVDEPTEGGPWLLEGRSVNPLEPSVARALVSPQSNTVVVHFLNHRSEEATGCKNSKIAFMELLEEADLPAIAVGCIEKRQPSSEQEATLWDVVQDAYWNLIKVRRNISIFFRYNTQIYLQIQTWEEQTCCTTRFILGGTDPMRQLVRRVLPPCRHEIQRPLQETQNKDVIQKLASPWAAPIVLVKMKEGMTRFCVDYRK